MVGFSQALAPITNFDLYEKDIAFLKKYNCCTYKLVLMKSVRKSGYVERGSSKGKKNTAGNTSKLDASTSRSRAAVRELVLCNNWCWFGTFTLSPECHDRFNIEAFKKQFSKWLQNLNYNNSLNIQYLLIPEQHKDGAWHMHGVLSGIPENWLCKFSVADNVPSDLVTHGYYNWPAYADKFGFVSLGRIENLEATANYITKYISKDISKSSIGLNKHLYFCSKGLKRAETLCRGHLTSIFTPDFSSDYVAIKTFNSYDEAIKLFSVNTPSTKVTFEMVIPPKKPDFCKFDNIDIVFDTFLSKLKNKYLEVVSACNTCPQT